jgi:hypothetical protein
MIVNYNRNKFNTRAFEKNLKENELSKICKKVLMGGADKSRLIGLMPISQSSRQDFDSDAQDSSKRSYHSSFYLAKTFIYSSSKTFCWNEGC